MKSPFVIWMGRQPLSTKGRLFRVVYRGDPRPERPDDVPFALEQRIGHDMMKKTSWGKPGRDNGDNGAEHEGVYALVHAFGQLLTVDPKKLKLDHFLWCEKNLAVSENRESRGCDCKKFREELDTSDNDSGHE